MTLTREEIADLVPPGLDYFLKPQTQEELLFIGPQNLHAVLSYWEERYGEILNLIDDIERDDYSSHESATVRKLELETRIRRLRKLEKRLRDTESKPLFLAFRSRPDTHFANTERVMVYVNGVWQPMWTTTRQKELPYVVIHERPFDVHGLWFEGDQPQVLRSTEHTYLCSHPDYAKLWVSSIRYMPLDKAEQYLKSLASP